MNKEQKLNELRKEEARLFRQEESLLEEKRLLENQIEDFERYCSDAQTQLWDSFETYPSSRIFFEQLQSVAFYESRMISESFLDDLDKVNLQKWKLEDDLNDFYHEGIRINQMEDEEDGN
ncbi:flagellar hook-associated protein [Streptococcus sp. Marseille-P7376]|uniref:flagellar hook-associated protein n=1 Tax=Streptococcus sp. Marseille-P7376 TaxID=2592044 RepID=UPI0011E64B01|nr:flagellar hook-associated protein [Streptococcus sp. Marseille-P7376]